MNPSLIRLTFCLNLNQETQAPTSDSELEIVREMQLAKVPTKRTKKAATKKWEPDYPKKLWHWHKHESIFLKT